MKKNISLSGSLRFISLADIFQMFGGNNSTGTLRLTGPHGVSTGLIYFVDGNPVNAIHGNLYGIEAINAVFGWTDGNFEFLEEKVQIEHIITAGRMKIVLDALRMLDEGIIKKVGPYADSAGTFRSDGIPNAATGGDAVEIKGPPIDYRYFIDEVKFSDAETIVVEGSRDEELMVILEGTVQMTKETPGGPVTISHLGEGSFIGTFAAFTYSGNMRIATATAMGDVYLGILDSMALYAKFSSLSIHFRKLLLSLTERMNKISCRLMSLFSGFYPNNIRPEETARIIETDSLYEKIYTITSGAAYLLGKTTRPDLALLILEKGDVFGHLPFFDLGQEPRIASVYASENLKYEELNKESILEEYERLPIVFQDMISNLCTCIAKTTNDCLVYDAAAPISGAPD